MVRNLQIHINSDIDRTPNDPTTGSWTSYLASALAIPHNSETRISVEACEIPNILYNFPVESSVFWFVTDPNGGSPVLKGVEIPTNRNFASGEVFAAYMNTAMSVDNISFAFSTLTNKLTITNNKVVPIKIVSSYRFGELINSTYNSAIDKLGFVQKIETNTAAGGTLVAQTILKLLRTNCFYITCSEVQSSQKESQSANPHRLGISHQIIARVSAENFGSMSKLAYASGTSLRLANGDINKLTFSILDDSMYQINDFYLPITITCKLSIQ